MTKQTLLPRPRQPPIQEPCLVLSIYFFPNRFANEWCERFSGERKAHLPMCPHPPGGPHLTPPTYPVEKPARNPVLPTEVGMQI